MGSLYPILYNKVRKREKEVRGGLIVIKDKCTDCIHRVNAYCRAYKYPIKQLIGLPYLPKLLNNTIIPEIKIQNSNKGTYNNLLLLSSGFDIK